MGAEVIVSILALALSFLAMLTYVIMEFSKMKTEIEHMKKGHNDFEEVKKLVYKIHAQNEVLLGLKSSPIS